MGDQKKGLPLQENDSSSLINQNDGSSSSSVITSASSTSSSSSTTKSEHVNEDEGIGDASSKTFNTTNGKTKLERGKARTEGGDGSRLFQPHRTIGLVTSSRPFALTSGFGGQSSTSIDAHVTVPLLERFVTYKCDALRPIMVSDALPSSSRVSSQKTNRSSGESGGGGLERMFYAISDSALSITIAAHSSKQNATHATLYWRQVVRKCIRICRETGTKNNKWGIVDVLDLGRSKFDEEELNDAQNIKHSKCLADSENRDSDYEKSQSNKPKIMKKKDALVLAFVCAKKSSLTEEVNNDLEVLGDSDDSDDDDDDNLSHSSDYIGSESSNSGMGLDSDDDSSSINCNGEVVVVLATRETMWIKKRISLSSVPDFIPSIAVHPHTYLNKIVIGSSCGGGAMILLNIRSGKVIHNFKCLLKENHKLVNNGIKDTITVLEQSPAVDTIAVGMSSGKVHLVNIRADVKLFSLMHHNGSKKIKANNEVRALSFRTDSAALESGIAPLAVGLADGSISIWDLTPSADDGDVTFTLIKSQKKGRRTLLCHIENAHPGGVSSLTYLPQEPLLLSSGTKSNRLIMHVFDNPDHSGRILRQRIGHSAPPRLIRYLHSGASGSVLASMSDGTDAASCQILSCGGAGDRSLRIFSSARSVLDREFGQGRGLEKKARRLDLKGGKSELLLNEIIAMARCDARSRDWGDLVTLHKDHAMAYVWSTKRAAQSGPVLRQPQWNISSMKTPPPKHVHATSVDVSSCGNFAVVGTRGGVIYKYNVQSGRPCGSYPSDATKKNIEKKKGENVGSINRTKRLLERDLKIVKPSTKSNDQNDERKDKKQIIIEKSRHINSAVTGLAVDSLNKVLISVGSDSKLIVWSFSSHAPRSRGPFHLPSPATKLVHVRDLDAVAVSLEDFSCVLFDFSSLSIVRHFGSPSCAPTGRHLGPITDLAFGPDGRRLFTSSLDGTIRVWDVPTNTCIDWLSFATPPTSLSLSSTGEFLATSHIDRLGIGLWCDKSFFKTVHLNVSKPILTPSIMHEPSFLVEDKEGNDAEDLAKNILMENEKNVRRSAEAGTSVDGTTLDTTDELIGNTAPLPKRVGLVTLSGLPDGHWKNLFNLELMKERNKPIEPPKKPPSAPFFLQYQKGQTQSIPDTEIKEMMNTDSNGGKGNEEERNKKDGDEWEAAWSDDDKNNDTSKAEHEIQEENQETEVNSGKKRKSKENEEWNNAIIGGDHDEKMDGTFNFKLNKKNKIAHHRSHFAFLLQKCYDEKHDDNQPFGSVTKYIGTLGPSAIDVAFGSLCNGSHDFDEGLHLLHLAAMWLLEAYNSKQNYDAVNAYLHRFLHIHSSTFFGIDEDINENINFIDKVHEAQTQEHLEKKARLNQRKILLETICELRYLQQKVSHGLRNKTQHTLCLLRHFSRMV